MTTVAASIILFFAFSTPVADNIVTQKQEIRSELLQPSNVISTTIEEFIQAEKNSEVTTSEKEGKTETINDNTSTEKQQKELEESSTTFSVVLCCGVPIQNATSYCENLNKQGINAIVDTSGKFIRVLIPGFSSREDALKEVRSLRSISKEFSNAWVMEKK